MKICQTRLLKLNFETIPKKRIFRFLPKIYAGHGWSWIFFCQFPNPWTLRVSGMGCYTSTCLKKPKSLHPNVYFTLCNGCRTFWNLYILKQLTYCDVYVIKLYRYETLTLWNSYVEWRCVLWRLCIVLLRFWAILLYILYVADRLSYYPHTLDGFSALIRYLKFKYSTVHDLFGRKL